MYTPLVSVIIPCYNHGRYLKESIESVKSQHYPSIEIIVVDDGSIDDTKEAAAFFPDVTYIYQQNQGLSAARNTGIANSKGEFLVFLDADDWLLPDAIEVNATFLMQNRNLAFVSGGHDKVFVQSGAVKECITNVNSEHYSHLLQGNYIGMHATVMYRRSVFQNVLFDTSLKNCEDYDIYFKIAREHEIHHHTHKIAAYRLHTSNMSDNTPAMLAGVLRVLERQKDNLKNEAELKAYKTGKEIWKDYYCKEIYQKLMRRHVVLSKEHFETLIKYRPLFFIKYMLNPNSPMLKTKIKEIAPDFGLKFLHRMGLYHKYVPPVNKVNFGDLDRRVKPLSKEFGYDRGGPIDRYYIEGFLKKEAESIQGRALEIGDNEYTLAFGGKSVKQSDVLHVHENNPKATFIGDISNAPHIPDNLFDCIILTQTLHLIYDFKSALRTCHRILKPGGVLLLTVPGITPIDHGEWKETWYWSFTDKAMNRIMAETFPGAKAEVTTFGNVFAASAFLYGLGISEVCKSELDYHDPHYQVIVSVKATKNSSK
ncbi:glycosyltransferase [Pontibacter sp. MBLB2868]|uniref:glycosyltransferase n=1 Tax=Pontibacter sp. MBLB2868 TaxID=3451555 RepID=UPI003F752530